MTQKILKVGSSAAITISKDSMDKLGVKIGDEVHTEIDEKNLVYKVKPALTQNLEVHNWTKNFIERYKPALDELAKL